MRLPGSMAKAMATAHEQGDDEAGVRMPGVTRALAFSWRHKRTVTGDSKEASKGASAAARRESNWRHQSSEDCRAVKRQKATPGWSTRSFGGCQAPEAIDPEE